jgi:hypothetical protein
MGRADERHYFASRQRTLQDLRISHAKANTVSTPT